MARAQLSWRLFASAPRQAPGSAALPFNETRFAFDLHGFALCLVEECRKSRECFSEDQDNSKAERDFASESEHAATRLQMPGASDLLSSSAPLALACRATEKKRFRESRDCSKRNGDEDVRRGSPSTSSPRLDVLTRLRRERATRVSVTNKRISVSVSVFPLSLSLRFELGRLRAHQPRHAFALNALQEATRTSACKAILDYRVCLQS